MMKMFNMQIMIINGVDKMRLKGTHHLVKSLIRIKLIRCRFSSVASRARTDIMKCAGMMK